MMRRQGANGVARAGAGSQRGVIARLRRLLGRGERGQSMVEFAIALPVFLIVVCAVIEFSLILSNEIQLTNATRDAARAGAIHFETAPVPIPDADRVTQAQTTGTSDASSLISCAAGTPTVNPQTTGSPEIITVSMSCTYTPVTPLGKLVTLFGGSVHLPTSITSSSTRYVEP